MKPFNREAALAGKPVVTRGGDRVIVTALAKPLPNYRDPEAEFRNLAVQRESGQFVGFYGDSGKFMPDTESQYDLFMGSVKKTLYVNFSRHENWAWYFDTEEAARKNADQYSLRHYAIAVPVEIEVGG